MDIVDGMRVFVATVQSGSLTAASKRLRISNRLASKYLGELEAEFGTRLIQRTTRKMSITSAGEQLMQTAPAWLDELDEMTSALSEDAKGLTGTIRVTTSVTFGELYVQDMLQRFASPHPGLTIDLRLADTYLDLVSEGIDVAFRIGQLGPSAMIARRLGETQLCLVASPDYLEKNGTPTTTDELTGHDCIRDTNLRNVGWPLHDDGQPIPISGRFMVNSARASANLAQAGEGIALCPDYVVAEAIADGSLISVLAETGLRSLPIHAVYPDRRMVSRRLRALLDFAAEDFGRR